MKIKLVSIEEVLQAVVLTIDGVQHCTADIRTYSDGAVICVSESTSSTERHSLGESIKRCISAGVSSVKDVDVDNPGISKESYLTYVEVPIEIFEGLSVNF